MNKPKEQKPSLKSMVKCDICKKKSLINITCTKCNNTFCIKHCCPEIHSCKHDHKKDFKMADRVVSSKIEVI